MNTLVAGAEWRPALGRTQAPIAEPAFVGVVVWPQKIGYPAMQHLPMASEELRFEPLVGADLESWLDASRAAYVAERLEAGDSEAEADANATMSFERLVPGGTPASGQHLGRLLDGDGRRVGHLWVGPMGEDPSRWWVWDVAIEVDLRGHGYGRSAMRLAERLARDHGASSMGLNVFAHNRVARSLYASLGYAESAVTMRKQLEQPKGGECRTVT